MYRKRHIPIAPGKFGAWVCLLTVALLWMPLWATAWQTDGMECCKGGMCMTHGHAMTQHSSRSAGVTQESTPMDCGHEGHAGLSACEMNCCHDQGSTVVAAVIFVMPMAAGISAPAEASDARKRPLAVVAPVLFEPPSPPPRSVSPVA